jgi:phosphoribosylformimino-5-aminoimidazole carboxamide ribotide isomerase
MILFPAIDLKGGQCVRLYKGAMDQATVFNDDPADQAARFVAAGAEWLHVVDLDGAFSGRPENRAAVQAILAACPVPVQLGGGIRDIATIEGWLAAGISRVILGTVAVKSPDLVKEAARLFPGRICVGIDARDGYVAVEGWAETSSMKAEDLGRAFADAGVAAIIYTDIDRDGTLTGANVTATAALAKAVPLPVIASGGIGSLEDLLAVKAARDPAVQPGIIGAICGRALYDGRVDLPSALQALKD